MKSLHTLALSAVVTLGLLLAVGFTVQAAPHHGGGSHPSVHAHSGGHGSHYGYGTRYVAPVYPRYYGPRYSSGYYNVPVYNYNLPVYNYGYTYAPTYVSPYGSSCYYDSYNGAYFCYSPYTGWYRAY